MSDAFTAATYSSREVGFGRRPAVLVVDFQLGFTDPRFPMGRSPRIHSARDRTAEVIAHARRRRIPVVCCHAGWQSEAEMQPWKIGALYDGTFAEGGEALRLDPVIEEAGFDLNFRKTAPSMFFQTPLSTVLVKHGIDTTLVTGCVTSGCVRATIVDSFSHGYRTIAVDDCCGDPMQESHDSNMRDVGRRYADVRSSEDVIDYLASLAA